MATTSQRAAMVPASLPAWKPLGRRRADGTRSTLAWASLTFLVPGDRLALLSQMGAIDLAYHLRAGEDVLHGNIPRVDTYTFTIPGTPWLDQQWLAQGVLALALPGGWMAAARCSAGGPGRSNVLARLPGRPHGRRRPRDRLAPHARRLRGRVAWARDATPTPRDAPVRGSLLWVAAGRARASREALARTRSRRPLRQHPRELRAVPRRRRARLARGSARARMLALGRTLLIAVVTAARHPRHAVRPPGVDLRVRPVHQPRHPETRSPSGRH